VAALAEKSRLACAFAKLGVGLDALTFRGWRWQHWEVGVSIGSIDMTYWLGDDGTLEIISPDPREDASC
jgi:hypothetical protein